MKIEVKKIAESPNSTMSLLSIGGEFFCFVIEDGFRQRKVAGETRIPGGAYKIIKRTSGKFFQRYNARFGLSFALQIADVPGFQDILIHTGNTKDDTRGCLLVAFQAGRRGADFVGCAGTSVPAYLQLYDRIFDAIKTGDEVTIEIVR